MSAHLLNLAFTGVAGRAETAKTVIKSLSTLTGVSGSDGTAITAVKETVLIHLSCTQQI